MIYNIYNIWYMIYKWLWSDFFIIIGDVYCKIYHVCLESLERNHWYQLDYTKVAMLLLRLADHIWPKSYPTSNCAPSCVRANQISYGDKVCRESRFFLKCFWWAARQVFRKTSVIHSELDMMVNIFTASPAEKILKEVLGKLKTTKTWEIIYLPRETVFSFNSLLTTSYLNMLTPCLCVAVR